MSLRVTEADVDNALDFLLSSAPQIGAAHADMVKANAMLRHVKALVMKTSNAGSAAAQERDAYAHQNYLDAINDEFEAVKAFHTLKAKREAASATIEAWRTMNANMRATRL